ncbi:MAG: PQQ-dependent sugar dehydrogenase [Fibrobacteria bacterium]
MAAGPAAYADIALPAGFTHSELGRRLNSPTSMAVAPDGRVFVCEQGGEIRLFRGDSLQTYPFLAVATNVDDEEGLTGIALDPGFARNGYVYLNYTSVEAPRRNQIHRFTAKGDTADPRSDTVIYDFDVPKAKYHLGGSMAFGPEGYLYFGAGESGYGGSMPILGNTYGNIMRIRTDGSIPADNPFIDQTHGKHGATWATGFRAPFHLILHKESGQLYAFDVGGEQMEEINALERGADYGWPSWEGPSKGPTRSKQPVFSYPHGAGPDQGNCITGGVFYPARSGSFPDSFRSKLFFADFFAGWIRVFDPDRPGGAAYFAEHLSAPVALGVSPKGSLYALMRGKVTMDGGTGYGWNVGSLVRIDYASASDLEILAQPSPVIVSAGEPAGFRIAARSGAPITYQWQRRKSGESAFRDIPGARGAELVLAKAGMDLNGDAYRCMVAGASIGSRSLPSAQAALRVTRNHRPRVFIDSPRRDFQFIAGDSVSFHGHGTDPEDGPLPEDRLAWTIESHFDAHAHPLAYAARGPGAGAFFVAAEGESLEPEFHRIILSVKDKEGLVGTDSIDILPKRVRLTFRTEPAELLWTLDGRQMVGASTVSSVIGKTIHLASETPQEWEGSRYLFLSWSDGMPLAHKLAAPERDTEYVLRFQRKTLLHRLEEYLGRLFPPGR